MLLLELRGGALRGDVEPLKDKVAMFKVAVVERALETRRTRREVLLSELRIRPETAVSVGWFVS